MKKKIILISFGILVFLFSSVHNGQADSITIKNGIITRIKDNYKKKTRIVTNDDIYRSKYLREYLQETYETVRKHWETNDFEKFNNELTSVIVMKISNTGEIMDYFFEKKSSNERFNMISLKAVLDSDPFPRFPPDINKESIEVGFRFYPNKLY